MDTYTITFKRKFWFDKKFKNVKGNLFPQDLNPNGYPARYMLIIFDDEKRAVIDVWKYDGYELSKELFYINAKRAKEESQGQADITS